MTHMHTAPKVIIVISLILVGLAAYFSLRPNVSTSVKNNPNSLTIDSLRQRQYPGSDIKIEETLTPEPKYNRYIASYYSDGLKIYALLLVPSGTMPKGGWPAIIFNHGYIIPEKYTPDGNYISYADALADAGFLVFKPNYRGNGESEGHPTSAYFAPDYIIDELNAISSIKKYKGVNPEKIGMWGHSMGGYITLKTLVIASDIKAASIWGGVVAPVNDIIYNWQSKVTYKPDALDLRLRNQNRDLLLKTYQTPSENPAFWNSVDPFFYLKDINAPVQIEVGLADNQVPPEFSNNLYKKLSEVEKKVEYREYEGANHDINQSFEVAMKSTIDFLERYLK